MEKNLLVVDDEITIRKLFHTTFNRRGYRVSLAENAEQAMEILKNESIMVMLLNLNLPAGVSGIDCCQKLREEGYMGFVFAITGLVDRYSLMQCRSAGFDDFFTKPFSMTAVIDATEHAFKKLKRWEEKEYAFF